jgi:hypothetical protein
MTQLQFGTEANVAGEQAESRGSRQLLKRGNQIRHSWTRFPRQLCKQMMEPENVGVEKPLEITTSRRNAMCAEAFPDKRRISPAGEIQTFGGAGNSEFSGKRARKSLHARATCADQRAIDIEQNEPEHGLKVWVCQASRNEMLSV